jgi:hypothetical protein
MKGDETLNQTSRDCKYQAVYVLIGYRKKILGCRRHYRGEIFRDLRREQLIIWVKRSPYWVCGIIS